MHVVDSWMETGEGESYERDQVFFSLLSNYILRDRHKCLTSWVAVEL